MTHEDHRPCVALMAAPWPLYHRPSIQLGVLKAYLSTQFPGLRVEAHHFYLQVARAIGYDRYQRISRRTWLAESVYAALLHPGQRPSAEKLFFKEARGDSLLTDTDFGELLEAVARVSRQWAASLDGSRWLLAGFSNSLCQFSATLYLIRCIKARWPDLPVALGGAGVAPAAAIDLRAAFPEIDFVVSGEGEAPLAAIVSHLSQGHGPQTLPLVAGVNMPQDDPECPCFHQLPDLLSLPGPDYDDYFDLLASFSPEDRFFPSLGVEMSRGCWWRRRDTAGRRSGCSFCNLNLQWNGYRFKNEDQVCAEVDALTRRHQVLSVAFMDNALPPVRGARAFEKLTTLGKDLAVFAEIRATTPLDELQSMERAGLREVQIGIEGLTSRMLGRFNKGTRAVDNLEIMKNCQELGIISRSNLILEFPGSDAEDVAETIKNMEFARWFRPLRGVSFWLGYGSPVWRTSRAHGMRAVYNHPNFAALFPEGPLRRICQMIQAYRGDRGRQRSLWRPVRRHLALWKETYEALVNKNGDRPLSYNDGGDFIIIRQCRTQGEPINHRLTGTSRRIYLYCLHQRRLISIKTRFAKISEDRLLGFMREMIDKRLMFEDDGRYLSLAVRDKKRC